MQKALFHTEVQCFMQAKTLVIAAFVSLENVRVQKIVSQSVS